MTRRAKGGKHEQCRRDAAKSALAVGVVIILAAFGFLLYGGIDKNVVFFLTPEELLARGSAAYDVPVRLGGLVQPGSVKWDAEKLDLRFVRRRIAAARSVNVHSSGAPPQMFRDGMGVVVEGRYHRTGVFESTNLMVKHSNEYRKPEHGERPQADVQVPGEGEPARDAIAGTWVAAGRVRRRDLRGGSSLFWGARQKRADVLRSGELALYAVWGLVTIGTLSMIYALVAARLQRQIRGAGRQPGDAAVLHGHLAVGRARGIDPVLDLRPSSLSALVTYQNRAPRGHAGALRRRRC